MCIIKYPEKDGIIVYVPIKNYSKERKTEFNLREWMSLDDKGAEA